jgi:hypothetical protein
VRRLESLAIAYSRALWRHIDAENTVLFPEAEARLPQTGVPELERYINGIRTLKSRFVQSNPNGSVVQGTLYVRRPGRMRFEYDAPSQLKIVADGYQVTMWDIATRDFGQWPIGWTAASFLVGPAVLSGDLRSRSSTATAAEFTMRTGAKPQEGGDRPAGGNRLLLRG